MRVTTQGLTAQVTEGLQRAYQRVARAQEIVTTGRRINHLIDDPIGATRALRLRGFEDGLGQYQRNISNSVPFLEQSDAVLEDVFNGLVRAKELAVAMANDTNSATERQAAANEVRQIFSQILSDANTQVENRFLFGGYLNGSAPFAIGASRVNYLGDNGEIQVQTNATSSLTINLLGNKVFQGAGVVDGQGVFDILQDLETALRGNSSTNGLTLAINLNAAISSGSGFSPTDAVGTEAAPATLNAEADFSTTVSVFDSKGQKHNLQVLFAKTGASTYKYRVFAESAEITGGTAGQWYQVGSEGTLAFNVDGTLNGASSTVTAITLAGLANGAADITIAAGDISFAGSTQLSQPSAVLSLTQTNANGIQAQIGRLDAAINQIITFRSQIGERVNGAKVSGDALAVLKERTAAQRSQIEDADVLGAYSDFARFQSAFQAALQSASMVIQRSLLDFLR